MQIAEARKKLLQNKEFEKEYQKKSLSWEIAKMIVRARLMKNMTQSKLAELVNTQQPSIARIESGERLPSLAILEKIAEAMGSYLIPPKIAFLDNSFTLTTNSSTKEWKNMTDTQKIVDSICNCRRGSMDDKQYRATVEFAIDQVIAEERARILAVIRKRCRLPITDIVEFIDELEKLTKKD